MANIPAGQLIVPAPPNLPLATADYSRRYHDQFANVLRLYFNQLNTLLGLVVGDEGGQHMSFPYGSFISTDTQPATVVDTPYVITYSETISSNSVVVDPTHTSRLIVDETGLYNFQFSLQLDKSSASKGECYIWARVNGHDVLNSTTQVTVFGSAAQAVAAWNFYQEMNAGDYFELVWASDSTNTRILSATPVAYAPAIPSVIMTVNFVSLLQG